MSVSFEAIYKGRDIGNFDLPLLGEHNVLNSLAAIGVALELQIDIPVIKEALKRFGGIQRRFEFKGATEEIRVFDDYGHHPTEIKATLRAAKEGFLFSSQNTDLGLQKAGRLFVLFQPHRYTRTRDLMDEFASSFRDADFLILLDIYPAGEKPIEGINSAILFEKIKKNGRNNALHVKDKDQAIMYIISNMRKDDLLLTLGAGDVWKIGDEILRRLRSER
jgi:UDP-N-acetylmuramate--alanine ligase